MASLKWVSQYSDVRVEETRVCKTTSSDDCGLLQVVPVLSVWLCEAYYQRMRDVFAAISLAMMTIPMGAAASKVAHVEPGCVHLNAKKPLNPKTQTLEGCLF